MAKSIIQTDKSKCYLCGRNAHADYFGLDEHHVIVLSHHTAASHQAGLGGDIVVLQTLTATLLGDLLALGAGAQIFLQLRALAEAVFGDGQQGLTLLGLLCADDIVSVGQ